MARDLFVNWICKSATPMLFLQKGSVCSTMKNKKIRKIAAITVIIYELSY